MIDWLQDFIDKFKKDNEINNLKERSFYGSIQINFFKGNVVDINKHQTRKPTLMQGGKRC